MAATSFSCASISSVWAGRRPGIKKYKHNRKAASRGIVHVDKNSLTCILGPQKLFQHTARNDGSACCKGQEMDVQKFGGKTPVEFLGDELKGKEKA